MIEDAKFRIEFERDVKDFEKVRQYIAVRLYDMGYLSSFPRESYLARAFAGELYSVIVFDLPQTISNVEPQQAAPWGKTFDELFDIGRLNVRTNYETKIETMDFGADGDILYLCIADHPFAANMLYDLEAHPLLVGPCGSLVAAPNRNTALVYPFGNLDVVAMFRMLVGLVWDDYDNNPGMLTKEIYWYRNGVFTLLPYELTKYKLKFRPSPEFSELLLELAEKDCSPHPPHIEG